MRIIVYNYKGIKVGEINNWYQVKIGNKNVIVFQGGKQIYPELGFLPIGQASIGNSFIIGGDSQ